MIKDQDTAYHTPDNVQYDWAETHYFYCYVPEEKLMAWVYFIARPGVGAMVVDVQFVGDMSTNPLDALYTDIQQHLPLPKRLEEFSLPNGLTYKAKNIRDYRLDYQGVDDTEIHVDVFGLMEPYDIHDSAMDPMAKEDKETSAKSSGFGSAYANHFDMTCRVKGKIKVRGKSYDVDCVSTMDHSWGPRPERGMSPMAWINAHFGEDYALQGIWSYEPREVPEQQFTFAHGYALVNGQVKGCKEGSLVVTRNKFDRFGVAFSLKMVDIDGNTHEAFGSPLSQSQWAPYSCTYVPMVFIRWQSGNRVGYGASQENNPLDRETGSRLRA